MRAALASALFLAGCATAPPPATPPEAPHKAPVTVITDDDNPSPVGPARFEVCSDKLGKVTSVKLLQSSGNATADAASQDALQNSPLPGAPVEGCRPIDIDWKLEAAAPKP